MPDPQDLTISPASMGNERVISFLRNKAIERQYHTYFDWKGRNANQFFRLFGEAFSSECKADVKGDTEIAESIGAFVELGGIRNELAHLNFAAFVLDKTTDECYEMYKRASKFVEYMRQKLAH